VPHFEADIKACLPSDPPRSTYFRNMLSRAFSLELSSALSDTYESGLEVVVASVVEVVEGAVDGAGDALALVVDESRDEGVVMIANTKRTSSPSPCQRDVAIVAIAAGPGALHQVRGHLKLRAHLARRAMTKVRVELCFATTLVRSGKTVFGMSNMLNGWPFTLHLDHYRNPWQHQLLSKCCSSTARQVFHGNTHIPE